jgi:uncharacterized membrane protein
MEKKILAVLLIIVGVIGLVMAEVNYTMAAAVSNAKVVAIYATLGAICFFSGFGLLPFSERATADAPLNEDFYQ